MALRFSLWSHLDYMLVFLINRLSIIYKNKIYNSGHYRVHF